MGKRIGDFEIDQDLRFQDREWKIQRLGWVAILLLVVLALLGLFGTGPLSTATASDADGPLSVDYQRFIRHGGRTTLTIRVGNDYLAGNEVEVSLTDTYLDGVEVQQITPQPQEVRAGDGELIYVFAVEDMTQPFEVSFSLRPQHIGRLSGEASITDGPTVAFDQISYP